jgi:putative transposase
MSRQGPLSIERMCDLAQVSRAGFYRLLRASQPVDEEMAVRSAIHGIAVAHRRRYGYRRITAELRRRGLLVNHKRVERIWRREGLKVPQQQPKCSRLWHTDGSCVRHRPTYRNHVWA